MAKFCSNCGKELNENADICLNCGVLVKKNTSSNVNNNSRKKGLPTWAIVLIVIGSIVLIPLIVIVMICLLIADIVEDSRGQYIEDAGEYFNNYVEEKKIVTEGTIGDSLEVDDVIYTLDSVIKYDSIGDNIPSDGNEYLVFKLNVYNSSDDEKVVTYIGFSGLVDDEKCDSVFLPDEFNGFKDLYKKLDSHEKSSLYAIFEVPKNWEKFDLSYSEILRFETITFYVSNDNKDSEVM